MESKPELHGEMVEDGVVVCARAYDATNECDAVLRLLAVDGVGPARIGRLISCFGSASLALAASPVAVGEALRSTPADAARILEAARRAEPSRERARIEACGGSMILRADARFPALLAVAPDPPAALFVRGPLAGAPEPCVAIVGSRRATPYGRLQAARIAGELAARGVVVVSGGARGIDAEAHRAALRAGGRTIAVLAAGLEQPYPPEHAPLFDAIVEGGGAVLTEQLPEVPPRAEFFPRRNRIVAGLSLATVVIEAAQRSGALVTARIAVEDLSREVGCLPGRVDSPASEGCHRAIREGWARIVTGTEDVVAMLLEARTLAAGAVERMCEGAASAATSDPEPGKRGGRAAGGEGRRVGRGARGSDGSNSPDPHAPPTRISDDARNILGVLAKHGDRAGVPRDRPGTAGGPGIDELELLLGWPVPRIVVAALELERARLVERDAQGGFSPAAGRR